LKDILKRTGFGFAEEKVATKFAEKRANPLYWKRIM